MKSKLCCLINPQYTCGSCSYSQCSSCNDLRLKKITPPSHFLRRKTRKGTYTEWCTCSVTGRAVKSKKLSNGTFIWITRK